MKKFTATLLIALTLLGAPLAITGCSVPEERMSGESTSDVSAACSLGLMSAVSVRSGFHSKGRSYTSWGSGVIYKLNSKSGEAFIITNQHVVCSDSQISDTISVFLYGRENEWDKIKAEYIGGSSVYDIAVLRAVGDVFSHAPVQKATVADSDSISVGDTAIAIGNPEGAGLSATLGIISVVCETIKVGGGTQESVQTSRVIRVDTAVNSGNSGGGLFNSRGELIGIVNAKVVDEDVENIGYAIPISVASGVADNILENQVKNQGRTPMRALLGISLTESTEAVMDSFGKLSIKGKVKILSVAKDSAADGLLQKGDEITEALLNGKRTFVTRSYVLPDLMLRAVAGDTVTLKIKREGIPKTVKIELTEASLIPL